jgi:hypothetical protein
MTPVYVLDWLRDNMIPYFPLENFRDPWKEEE